MPGLKGAPETEGPSLFCGEFPMCEAALWSYAQDHLGLPENWQLESNAGVCSLLRCRWGGDANRKVCGL